MRRLQKILSDDRQIELPADAPAEPRVGGGIRGDQLAGQGANIPVVDVRLKALGEIDRQLNRHLVLRAGAHDPRRGANVFGIRRSPKIHVQKRIGTPQPQKILRPPFGSNFHSLGVAEQSVAELGGQQEMRGLRAGFQVRRSRDVFAKQVVVMVVKGRDIDDRDSGPEGRDTRVRIR